MRSNGSFPAYEVDGRQLKTIHRPANTQEIAELLRDADNLKKPLVPIGGGSALALGNGLDSSADGLELLGLNRVIHFEPADLTLSVEAGARFADVQRTLADRGQTLPIEVPDIERATIGGLIATALAGPRRLGSGTLRDLLIGISVAYPSGIVAKAGGLVVKNVTGFDMMRLHHGALGTLGVIDSANFKTVPLSRQEKTIVADFGSMTSAFEASDCVRSSRVQPLALEILKSGDFVQLAVRISGRPSTVDLLAAETKSLLNATTRELAGAESKAWWTSYVEAQSLVRADRVLVRCGAAPNETSQLTSRVLLELSERALAPELLNVSPGLGLVLIGLPASKLTAKSLAGLQTGLLAADTEVTIMSAPCQLKAGIDVWGRPPQSLPVMKALKAEFDPNRILNPGRLVGRI